MSKVFIRFFCTQLTILLCLVGSSWAAEQSFSLESMVQLALENNPQMEIARQQYLADRGSLTQARSSYLPQVSAGAGFSRLHIDNLQPVDEDNIVNGLLSVSQLIYDFGKTTGFINANAFNMEASNENFKQVTHNIVFQVKSAFYSVLEKQHLIKVAEQAVSNYQQQLDRAQQFYETGVRTRLDATNAEVNLATQKLNLLRAQSNLKVAGVHLEKTLGIRPAGGHYTLVSDDPNLDSIITEKPEMVGQLDQLLEKAMDNRPGLKQYNYLLRAAESIITQARGEYMPTVRGVGSYDVFETDVALPTLEDHWSVGVGLTWQLFSGFETEGKVAKAKADFRKVQAALRDFELSVMQEVTDSYLRADENRQGIDIAAQGLKLAEDNLDLADVRYKTGIGNLLEFNDAQLLYTESQSNVVITYYNYLTSLARIEQAIGVFPALEASEGNVVGQ